MKWIGCGVSHPIHFNDLLIGPSDRPPRWRRSWRGTGSRNRMTPGPTGQAGRDRLSASTSSTAGGRSVVLPAAGVDTPEVALLTLLLIGLVEGLVTGISPCVLPVLPVIFMAGGTQSADRRRPFLLVIGLALSFCCLTLLGTLILRALHLPQGVIRWTGLVVLVLLGLGMIVPRLEALLERPFRRIPQLRLGHDVDGRPAGVVARGGFFLGLALGAVYVPCAGLVLASITLAGATGHIGVRTVALTAAFAIGTALPLLIFALAGRRVAERVKAFRNHQRGVRVAAGVVTIALALALTFNVTDVLQRAIPDYTSGLDTALSNADAAAVPRALSEPAQNETLAICAQDLRPVLQGCGPAPEIAGIAQWLNTDHGAPESVAALRGKVVLVDFWAYSCINCQRAIPHVNAWYSAYAGAGLAVIGVHTPEYAFEHVAGNVAAGVERLGITYPVALDNDYTTWENFGNNSWPADYLIDADGQVRHVSRGEGNYAATESLIRQLLTAASPGVTLPKPTLVDDETPTSDDLTPETYLGVTLQQTFAGSPPLAAGARTYTFPAAVPDDQFALSGVWAAGDESITAQHDSAIRLNFHAGAVYIDVGGTGTMEATVDGRISTIQVSGAPDAYPLVPPDPSGKVRRSTLTVALSPGLTAYSFTFG